MALSRIIVPGRLAASMEPTVIDTALMLRALEEERQWEEAAIKDSDRGREIRWPPLDLGSSDKLVLSFSRIRSIENLSGLRGLRELKLDNNGISE